MSVFADHQQRVRINHSVEEETMWMAQTAASVNKQKCWKEIGDPRLIFTNRRVAWLGSSLFLLMRNSLAT